MLKVSVVIIHWNTPGVLAEQLEHLKSGNDIEVIVVDNFSTKEVRKKVSAISSKSAKQVVLNNENEGFAKAGNIGAQLAHGEWLLFLNPDVQISNAAVMEFVGDAEERRLDAASPQTKDPRYSKPLPSPSSLATEFSPLHRVIPLSVFKQKTLTGGCLLIRKDVFERVGKWDEQFFLWFEDSDLTKRLLDAHSKIGWVPVNASHKGGVSFEKLEDKERNKMFFNSMNLYANKHFSRFGNRVVELLSKRFT